MSYQVDGFIDKNKDLLYRDLSQLMFSCERKLLRQFFPEGLVQWFNATTGAIIVDMLMFS